MGKRCEASANTVWSKLFCIGNQRLSRDEQIEIIRQEMYLIAKGNWNRGMKQMMHEIEKHCEERYEDLEI